MIIDFRSRFDADESILQFARWHSRQLGMTIGDHGAPLEIYVAARINAADLGGRFGWQGRWIADCKSDDCAGAEYVDLTSPIFYCCSCGNREFGGAWLKVKVPVESERLEIERLLEKRPAQARNWDPGDTIEKIRRINAQRGIED